ncbi:ABC transporter permease [Lawsonibacter hominis]|uniref:ABC transporter permease n=1 Tax=Lawsonibacter hominis TaxID=2763053 RepID=UPI0033172C22
MFSKLAFQNVRRSLKDYSVYFLTLTFGVCIFYVFNSMESQYVMEILLSANKGMIRVILQLIDVVSVFVSVVLGFLILYANGFMIRRRKKELGTYLLLGLDGGRVSALLFLETLLIGVFSLGIGLLLGVFLSQFISVFTAGLFAVSIPEFHFVFSPRALGKTLLYFGVIFLVVMLFNSFRVSRQKLIDLLRADRENQDLKLKSVGASVVMFLTGAILLIIAYAMLLVRGILRVDNLFFLMLALGTAGTLLFFRSLSGFLLKICQANKRLYYKGLNMFLLRQFNSRINSTYVSMTVICLMLLLAIGITACSVGLNNTVSAITAENAPYDVTVRFHCHGGDGAEPELEKWLVAGGFDPEQELAESVRFDIRQVELEPLTYSVGDREYTQTSLDAISLTDCNRLLALQGRTPLALTEGEYGLLWGTYMAEESFWKSLWADRPVVVAQGRALLAGGDVQAVVLTGDSVYSSMLVLPDALAASGTLSSRNLVGNYAPGIDPEQADERLAQAMGNLVPRDYDSGGNGYGYGWDSRVQIYLQTMGTKILVLFLGIYLGIVFLLCSAAVLALQQLSQAADNQNRYRVLARLGVEERMRDRSIYVQVFLAFFLPLALAVVHAAVGMTSANAAIAQVGRVDSAASSAVTAVFILVVYGAYFLATCWGSRRIIRGR